MNVCTLLFLFGMSLSGSGFLYASENVSPTASVITDFTVSPNSSQDVIKKFTEMLHDKKVEGSVPNYSSPRFQDDDDEDEVQSVSNKNGDFYSNYICKYYPKVFAIRGLFERMRPQDLENALRDITMLFSQDPWLYFVDDKKKFKTPMYWEFIVDQCSFIDDFLRRAKVDLINDSIIAPHVTLTYRGMVKSSDQQNLLTYLKKTPQAYVFDFYALCFDYLIKLFNEGILIKNMTQAQRYLYELEYVLERLKASRYEAIYQEALKTSKELMAKLKKILTKNELEEDDSHYDEKTRKMLQEGKELGFYS